MRLHKHIPLNIFSLTNNPNVSSCTIQTIKPAITRRNTRQYVSRWFEDVLIRAHFTYHTRVVCCRAFWRNFPRFIKIFRDAPFMFCKTVRAFASFLPFNLLRNGCAKRRNKTFDGYPESEISSVRPFRREDVSARVAIDRGDKRRK